MGALDRLLQCNGNPVAFFALLEDAENELEQIRKNINDDHEVYLEMRTANDMKDAEIKRLRNTLSRIKNGRGLWDENDMIRIAREELERIP